MGRRTRRPWWMGSWWLGAGDGRTFRSWCWRFLGSWTWRRRLGAGAWFLWTWWLLRRFCRWFVQHGIFFAFLSLLLLVITRLLWRTSWPWRTSPTLLSLLFQLDRGHLLHECC